FELFNMPWMLEGDYRNFNYPHTCTGGVLTPTPDCFVTTIGSTGATAVNSFEVRNYDFDARLGLKVLNPRVYIGLGYMWRGNNAGYPRQTGLGFGVEKLPDLDQPWSIYGSVYYYGNVKGNFTDPGTLIGYQLAYNILKYQLGVTYTMGGSPLFIDAGLLGERAQNKVNAPGQYSDFAGYIGLGLKF
ncbi:MAG TPA: hypothetical protein VNF68_04175, partial [Candidatus Baltobacteraceae bacterium]|nr:hypothetical protein [Candidatus Baltobacteraceae bacterium]